MDQNSTGLKHGSFTWSCKAWASQSLVGLCLHKKSGSLCTQNWHEIVNHLGTALRSAAGSCLTLCDPMDYSLPGSPVHEFSRQEHWTGWPFPSPGDLPNPGIKPVSPSSPALAGGFFTTAPPGNLKNLSLGWGWRGGGETVLMRNVDSCLKCFVWNKYPWVYPSKEMLKTSPWKWLEKSVFGRLGQSRNLMFE